MQPDIYGQHFYSPFWGEWFIYTKAEVEWGV
jgi:hypothetical protein